MRGLGSKIHMYVRDGWVNGGIGQWEKRGNIFKRGKHISLPYWRKRHDLRKS